MQPYWRDPRQEIQSNLYWPQKLSKIDQLPNYSDHFMVSITNYRKQRSGKGFTNDTEAQIGTSMKSILDT